MGAIRSDLTGATTTNDSHSLGSKCGYREGGLLLIHQPSIYPFSSPKFINRKGKWGKMEEDDKTVEGEKVRNGRRSAKNREMWEQ